MDDNIIYQRALYISPRKFFITKLCLRAASLVSGVVVMALVFWLLSYDASLPALILGPPTALSLCWSFSELICLFVRYGHNGIDPGAIVGCDLILWLGLITTTILTRLTRDGFYFEYPHANSKYASWGRRSAFYAGLAFAAANTVLHFVLFVIGCREVEDRKLMPKIAYIRLDSIAIPPLYPGQSAESPNKTGS